MNRRQTLRPTRAMLNAIALADVFYKSHAAQSGYATRENWNSLLILSDRENNNNLSYFKE